MKKNKEPQYGENWYLVPNWIEILAGAKEKCVKLKQNLKETCMRKYFLLKKR